jgi:hypothetical protein
MKMSVMAKEKVISMAKAYQPKASRRNGKNNESENMCNNGEDEENSENNHRK